MFRVCLAAALVCAVPSASSAQVVLTFEDVMLRARAGAPAAAAGRARVAEAEAAAAAAGRRVHDPVVEVAAGPRRTSGATITDIDIGVSQQFDPVSQRQARTRVAAAGVAGATARAAAAVRDEVHAAAAAFLRAVAAGERVRLAETVEAGASRLLAAMERRLAAGDVAAIEVNLARVEAARALASLGTARAARVSALGELRLLLRIPEPDIEVRGTLEVSPIPEGLRDRSLERPELAALDAEVREADAGVDLARMTTKPGFGVRAAYEREEGDTILLGGLTITLPSPARGQAAGAAASARAARARLDLQRARDAGSTRVDTAVSAHALRAAAAADLAAQALPAIADTDSLAERSYDAGELSLLDLLRIRRDAAETRLVLLELRLDAALSRLDVDYLAGVLR